MYFSPFRPTSAPNLMQSQAFCSVGPGKLHRYNPPRLWKEMRRSPRADISPLAGDRSDSEPYRRLPNGSASDLLHQMSFLPPRRLGSAPWILRKGAARQSDRAVWRLATIRRGHSWGQAYSRRSRSCCRPRSSRRLSCHVVRDFWWRNRLLQRRHDRTRGPTAERQCCPRSAGCREVVRAPPLRRSGTVAVSDWKGSAYRQRVRSSLARTKACGSAGSTNRVSTPWSLSVWADKFQAPSYRLLDFTILSPAFARF